MKGHSNGERPACKGYREHERTCEYASEPGVTPAASLKRKYEPFQAESAAEHDLLGILRTSTEAESIKVLAHLRSSDDFQATLHQARSRPDEDGPASFDEPRRPAAHQTPSQPGPPTMRTSIDISFEFTSVYPELKCIRQRCTMGFTN